MQLQRVGASARHGDTPRSSAGPGAGYAFNRDWGLRSPLAASMLTSSPRELGMRPWGKGGRRRRAGGAGQGRELRLCVGSTTAAVVTLAVSQLLNLPIALWAVLTAVILTQISV